MKNLILLMGKTASGKSTLESDLVKTFPEKYNPIISHTTRKMRNGEVKGQTYHFIEDTDTQHRHDIFKEMESNGEFLQVTHYDTEYYASAKSEYFTDKENTLLVVVPSKAKILKEKFEKEYPEINVIVVFFDISNERIRKNMEKRGDEESRIIQRLKNDRLREEFLETKMKADYTVYDNDLNDELVKKFDTWLTKNY